MQTLSYISARRVFGRGVAYGAAVCGAAYAAAVPAVQAQNSVGLPRGWEVGIAPAMRHLGGDLSYNGSRNSVGFVASAQYNATSIFGLRASIMRSHNDQMKNGSWPAMNETLPMVAGVLAPRVGSVLRPYMLVGVGYRSVDFTGPRCNCAKELEFMTPVMGIGAQYQALAHTALRAEFEMNPRNNVSSSQFLFGVAIAPGKMSGRHKMILPVAATPAPVTPAPAVVVVPPPVHVDTVVRTITKVDTIQAAAAAAKVASVPTAPLLVIPGAQFEVGKSELTSTAIQSLVEFANQLNSDGRRDVSIEVVGYTDSTGKPAANLALGLKRASAVRDALVAAHLDPNRISVSSGGASTFVASNDTKTGRQQNRRVVIMRRMTATAN